MDKGRRWARELRDRRVVLEDERRVLLRCEACGERWSPLIQRGGKLPRAYWRCPKGCNAPGSGRLDARLWVVVRVQEDQVERVVGPFLSEAEAAAHTVTFPGTAAELENWWTESWVFEPLPGQERRRRYAGVWVLGPGKDLVRVYGPYPKGGAGYDLGSVAMEGHDTKVITKGEFRIWPPTVRPLRLIAHPGDETYRRAWENLKSAAMYPDYGDEAEVRGAIRIIRQYLKDHPDKREDAQQRERELRRWVR